MTDGVDGIGQRVDVPVVDLDTVIKNLGTATLL